MALRRRPVKSPGQEEPPEEPPASDEDGASPGARDEDGASPGARKKDGASPGDGDRTAAVLAAWRVPFYAVMCYAYVRLRHRPADPAPTAMSPGADAWFAFDQFEALMWTMPTTAEGVAFNTFAGVACGAVAAIGLAFPLAAWAFFLLYFRQVFWSTLSFVNHDYLFVLLLFLTAASGAGAEYSLDAAVRRLFRGRRGPAADDGAAAASSRRCVLLALRAQMAVVYVFASLWKWHDDWLAGRIVRHIFLGFEAQGVARGVPWAAMEKRVGPLLFVAVALGGLALDSGMALTLVFLKPSRVSWKIFAGLSVCFHSFTAFAMSQRIDYAFPLACVAAVALFFPFAADDAPLVTWLARYASGRAGTRRQRLFLLGWVAIQLLVPLRMPYFHGSSYAITGQSYRFSWTMMLHAKDSYLVGPPKRKGAPHGAFMQLAYVSPYLLQRDAPPPPYVPAALTTPVPRMRYFPNSELPHEDDRTLPQEKFLGPRQRAFLEAYPRGYMRLAAGFGALIQRAAPPFHVVGASLTLFARLNGRGPYVRVADPTVDLVAADKARAARTILQFAWDVVSDTLQPPHEFLLRDPGGGATAREAAAFGERLSRETARPAHVLVDRSACLKNKPLWLRPTAHPLLVYVHRAPPGASIVVRSCVAETRCDVTPLRAAPEGGGALLHPGANEGRVFVPNATSIEIGIAPGEHAPDSDCRDGAEDVVLGLVL